MTKQEEQVFLDWMDFKNKVPFPELIEDMVKYYEGLPKPFKKWTDDDMVDFAVYLHKNYKIATRIYSYDLWLSNDCDFPLLTIEQILKRFIQHKENK